MESSSRNDVQVTIRDPVAAQHHANFRKFFGIESDELKDERFLEKFGKAGLLSDAIIK